jgi:tetratricopeptide (TPR) repeat protein
MRRRAQSRQPGRALLVLLAALALAPGCSQYQPLVTSDLVRREIDHRVPPDLRDRVELPFELDEATIAAVDAVLSPVSSESQRAQDVVAYIFSRLALEYSLTPTRDAVETHRTAQGNCLSFVNLFVGIGRHMRLNPFYVEVEDYQRWNYSNGVVVSRGHIVAGLRVDGNLATYDFLPYRTKGYRDFEPIDDLMAMAHYYNNLGAEALMADDVDTAFDDLRIATALAPDFEKAINNLGVVYLRRGDTPAAVALYEHGLELNPESVPILTNLARANQNLGLLDKATEILDQIEAVNRTNPFFFVYRGEVALAAGDTARALDYMRKALQTDPDVPEVHVGLVKVYLALGDVEKARYHVERALRLDATHEEARKYAALLEARSPAPGQ